MKKYKIALIQMNMIEDVEKNTDKALYSVSEASKKNADIVCLPELFKHMYFCQTEDPDNFNFSEKLSGENFTKFTEAARKNNIVLIYPFFEFRSAGIYHNSLAVINSDGKVSGVYRKMHIPDDPGYYEKYYFTPGDRGFNTFKTSAGTIGTLICWDQWFPEASRIVSLKGAHIIFYPTAIGWHPDEIEKYGQRQLDAWITIQRSHAISNGVYIASVNRVGTESVGEKDIRFWGNSFVCGPEGEIISEASNNDEEIIYAEIDPGRLENTRRHWPFLRDRRVDSYSELSRIFLDDDNITGK